MHLLSSRQKSLMKANVYKPKEHPNLFVFLQSEKSISTIHLLFFYSQNIKQHMQSNFYKPKPTPNFILFYFCVLNLFLFVFCSDYKELKLKPNPNHNIFWMCLSLNKFQIFYFFVPFGTYSKCNIIQSVKKLYGTASEYIFSLTFLIEQMWHSVLQSIRICMCKTSDVLRWALWWDMHKQR